VKKAVVTAVVVALLAVAVAVWVVRGQHGHVETVADLDRGDCVDAGAFLRGEQPALADLTRADCDDPHDAEVLLVVDLDAAQAAAYRPEVPDAVCTDALGDRDSASASGQRLLIAGVADAPRPDDGDQLACFAFAADGDRIDGRVLTR